MRRLVSSIAALAVLILLPHAAAQLSGVVEIEMRTVEGEVFFDPVGVWVEPGTTIRFVLVDGMHDTQAYHPDNATDLTRIPEGAEPWNSGMLGGIRDETGVFEVTLTVEGVYDYFCSPHHAMGMVGRIVVGDPDEGPAQPLDELPFEEARGVLPTVEEIVAREVVSWADIGALETERAADHEEPDMVELGFWTGDAAFTTEAFEVSGPWEITLGAWCFEGVGWVRVVAVGADGEEVGETTVIGEGIETVTFDTEPGEYHLEVEVSHFHTYIWELQVMAAAQPIVEEPDVDDFAPLDADAATVAIPHEWEGTEVFTTEPFEASGEWEIVLGAWCHDGVSFARATAYDQEGNEVGQVTVVPEGVNRAVMNTQAGVFTIEVWSPDMDAYHWELMVTPVESAAD